MSNQPSITGTIIMEIITQIIMIILFGVIIFFLIDTFNDDRSITCGMYYNTTKPLPWFCGDTP